MLTPFIQYVAEARVVRRQSDLERYTFDEITERIYLSFLALSLMKNYSQTAGFVKTYATQTVSSGNFDRVRTTANDLANMMAVVVGNKEIVMKLANKNQAMAQRERRSVPELSIRRYLRTLTDDYKFLTELERALGISNSAYRNLRRAIGDYINLDSRSKQVTVTRLLQALKAKLAGTDIQRKAQEFADKQKLELDNVIDAERKGVPGSELTPDEMAAYRVLVGASNVRRAKVAVDMIKQGKAVPAPIMAAYAPIVQMIDDIAKGGFTYVRLLQSIRDRAKK